MTRKLKLAATLPLITLLAACVGNNDRVDTIGEIEATTDTAIVGSTVPGPNGTQVQP